MDDNGKDLLAQVWPLTHLNLIVFIYRRNRWFTIIGNSQSRFASVALTVSRDLRAVTNLNVSLFLCISESNV